jgi:hypothetical protein
MARLAPQRTKHIAMDMGNNVVQIYRQCGECPKQVQCLIHHAFVLTGHSNPDERPVLRVPDRRRARAHPHKGNVGQGPIFVF